MDSRSLGIIAILLLFDINSYCFADEPCQLGPNTLTPETPVHNITTSPEHRIETFKTTTSTSTTYDHLDISHINSSNTNGSSLLDIMTLTSGSQRTISELKCGEYAEEVVNIPEVHFISDDNYESILFNHCKRLKFDLSDVGVVGGTRAYIGEYPHMVALGRYNSDRTFILVCGGTLISHTWVLTAAHCTYGPNGSPSVARMGMDRLEDQYHFGTTIPIKNMVRHPDYKLPALYADIALVELATPVTFSLVMYPACLHQEYDLPLYSFTQISGWGATEVGGDQSDYLQHLTLSVIDNLKCAKQHRNSREIPQGISSSMICAGGEVNKDACNGDSGGPLQIQKNFCMRHIIGITSFGRSCGFANSSGVYTRISHYVPWIESIVWPRRNNHDFLYFL